jgi:hypothetical protein
MSNIARVVELYTKMVEHGKDELEDALKQPGADGKELTDTQKDMIEMQFLQKEAAFENMMFSTASNISKSEQDTAKDISDKFRG